MLLGIIGAMPEEMEQVISAVNQKEIVELGSRLFYKGTLFNQPVVVAFSRWGKVAAATTAATMILHFKVNKIVFTGVAGSISPELKIGDVVIAQRLFQHDMDARPLMRRFEIPLTGKTSYEISEDNQQLMSKAVHQFLKNDTEFRKELAKHGIQTPKLVVGDIASGDLFISSPEMKAALSRNLPSVVCAEMEGAAVAQVCEDFEIPLTVVRIISDMAEDNAHLVALNFVNRHAGTYSSSILKEFIQLLQQST